MQAMNHSRNDVTDAFFEVVVGSEDVAGHDGSKGARVLLMVRSVQHVDHPLRVAVAEIAVVRRAVVNLKEPNVVQPFLTRLSPHHCLVDGVSRVVGEDARRETRHNLFDVKLVTQEQNVVVHLQVGAEETQIIAHVVEQSADFCC